MKASEMRDKNAEELGAQLLSLREEQFKLRMQKSTGQLAQTHLLKENQRDIARVKTVLHGRDVSAGHGSEANEAKGAVNKEAGE